MGRPRRLRDQPSPVETGGGDGLSTFPARSGFRPAAFNESETAAAAILGWKGESPQVEARLASILIVDDENLVRSMTRTALERAGHRVAEAANGDEALALLERERFDLAVIDLIMPEKEGIETIAHIRRLPYGLKIVAASGGGKARLDLLPIARRAGADYTIGKPFNIPELVALVARALVD